MPNPTVSIVLPFWNAGPTIAEAIDSIIDQTWCDWELILFDDGSADGSWAIAEAYARSDARIRVIRSPHVGIVGALQRGCEAAVGEYIARMDADDIARPARIEKQLALMTAQPDVALCGTQVEMFGPNVGFGRRRYETWVNRLTDHDQMTRELFVECPIPHPTFLIRRAAYTRVGGYLDNGWAEDYDLCFRLWAQGYRMAKALGTLLRWRDTPGRLSMVDARYAPYTFRALKRHYLFRTYLNDRPVFHQWGAGEVGKQWLREWTEPRPEAVVDINPRKIGRRIHGFQVISPEALPPPGQTLIVVAVGTPGARDDIRGRLEPRGYRECRDYLFLA
ncbi:MAG TPA: glycosyltransferase [Candidatus Hydrogenedentes bacterium]|nr:glycosyltransferase [Candidatus Hydrogenedentota bacterium]